VDLRLAHHPKLVVVDAQEGRRTPIWVRGRCSCKRAVFEWRDPDSNRGHHDFQVCREAAVDGEGQG
jgi:hypothetical protein